MRKKAHICIGIDPSFRKYGFAQVYVDLAQKRAEFEVFKRFDKWIIGLPKLAARIRDTGYTYTIGIENSYLAKKYFFEGGKTESARINLIASGAMNRAVSDTAVRLLKQVFDKDLIFEFKPALRGKRATGGKKSDFIFQATLKTYGIEAVGYRPPPKPKRKQITSTRDQDMRDAFYMADRAYQEYTFRNRRI